MKAKLYINSEESTIRIEGGTISRTTSRSRWRGCPGFSTARFVLWTRRITMKIKSTVLQVLAAACLGAGLLYAMGIEGGAQLGGTITDGEFVTAMVLILAALALMRISFAV